MNGILAGIIRNVLKRIRWFYKIDFSSMLILLCNNYYSNMNACTTFIKNILSQIIPLITRSSILYISFILLHYISANLYPRMCAPISIIGFITSPFIIITPYCETLRWIIGYTGTHIRNMWFWLGGYLIIYIENIVRVNSPNKSDYSHNKYDYAEDVDDCDDDIEEVEYVEVDSDDNEIIDDDDDENTEIDSDDNEIIDDDDDENTEIDSDDNSDFNDVDSDNAAQLTDNFNNNISFNTRSRKCS
jgi:hypothetical protein